MAPEQKDDIVCAFHGDLEKRLDSIDGKLDAIKRQLNDMSIWRAEIRGSAKTAAAVISFIVTIIVLIIKEAIARK